MKDMKERLLTGGGRLDPEDPAVTAAAAQLNNAHSAAISLIGALTEAAEDLANGNQTTLFRVAAGARGDLFDNITADVDRMLLSLAAAHAHLLDAYEDARRTD